MAGSLTEQTFVWDRNDGGATIYVNGTTLSGDLFPSPDRLPEGVVYHADNVDLEDNVVCKPRRGVAAFSTAGSEPTDEVKYLFVQRSSTFTTTAGATTLSETLWAFDTSGSAAMNVHSWDGSTWTSHTLPDTAANVAQPHCVSYNGKLFTAYNSASNRLHCYDGTQWRRVGVGTPAAATVANTGAGAYAATLRYYKIQFRLYNATSVLQASSELSAAVSFTPSGAGAAARVTKPATVDSATHWVVYGSADGSLYYRISGDLEIATVTTFDDNLTPANYSAFGGEIAPEVGLFIPPPSARFLCTDGTRLVMAGSFETSASSGETTPGSKRVWFTRPIGATDRGDDESITQTATSRYYLDIDDETQGTITGLAAINGLVYVFFPQSVWRLVPTGLSDAPYRSEQVSATAGAMSQYAIAVGGTDRGAEEAIYCISQQTGFHRISASGGVEWLGDSVVPRANTDLVTEVSLVYDPAARDLWVFIGDSGGSFVAGVIDVTRFRRSGNNFYGGMRSFSVNSREYWTAAAYAGSVVFAGQTTFPFAATLDYFSGTTDHGTGFNARVISAALTHSTRRVTLNAPVVRYTVTTPSSPASMSLFYYDSYSRENVGGSGPVTLTETPATQGARSRVHGLERADAHAPQLLLTTTTGTGNVSRVEHVVIPFQVQEAV